HAARDSWPMFKRAGAPVRLIHQTGPALFEELQRSWIQAGLDGEISAFIFDMSAAFDPADLIVCPAGGPGFENAAAGKTVGDDPVSVRSRSTSAQERRSLRARRSLPYVFRQRLERRADVRSGFGAVARSRAARGDGRIRAKTG